MIKGIRYADEQKQALIEEYQTSGMSLSRFCSQQGKPSYAVMSKWIKAEGEPVRQISRSNSVGGDSALFTEFTKSLMPDDVQTRYIAFLEKRVRELEAQLAQKDE
ncbi:hypothetical protein ACQ259_02985 [Stutzerimonas stutzeri]|uniref:hypothetical protein n=1 Tax=Stutzerimonas stutzeri TaxID=316 RepID=UPI003D30F9D5